MRRAAHPFVAGLVRTTERPGAAADRPTMRRPTPRGDHPRAERRARQPLRYSAGQLLGRQPIRLRRRTDKLRLVVHVIGAVALAVLALWWVLPRHAFSGPVLLVVAPGRGIHAGDLPSVLFVMAALRSLGRAASLLRGD